MLDAAARDTLISTSTGSNPAEPPQGKHAYCEKPLTWSVSEARLVAETARRAKVATGMTDAATVACG